MEWIADTITIRQGPRDIVLQIQYSSLGFAVKKAVFKSPKDDGRYLILKPDGSIIQMPNNNHFFNITGTDCGVVITIA